MVSLLLTACQSYPTKQIVETSCPEPKPEVCTMHFKHVCGVSLEGGEKTFSNACTACSDKTVIGFNQAPCIK